MRRKKLLAGVLTTALLVGSISPAGVMGAGVPEGFPAEQLMIEETGRQGDEEEAVTAEEEVKSAEADENEFVIENGVLTKYTGAGGDVTIPDGVTSIGDNAFYGCSGLTSITIPDSMTSIGEYAFGNCSNLASITIPTNVTSIGDDAFYFCNSLTAINVSKENVNYTSENGILYDKNKRTLIQCPGGKTGELIIPGSVECLGETAFMGCDVLNSITMPDSVERIGKNTFGHCYGLTAINVSEKNPTYTSENGILYDKNKRTLIRCPGGKAGELIIPDSVEFIGEYAVSRCLALTDITIPASVQSIGDSAFYYNGFTDITIPTSVQSIEAGAFYRCQVLRNITIPDSVVSIGKAALDWCSPNLTVFCVKGSYAETYATENSIKCSYIGAKNIQTITANDAITKAYGDSIFSIGAVTDGDGTLRYISDNEAVAKVDSTGTVTITGAGTAHITIRASETALYKVAKKIITITVEKKSQTITAADITKTLGEAAFPLNATVDGDGTFTYVSDNPSVAAIAENGTVTLVSAGTAHITITASETANCKAAEKVITVTVKPSETPDKEPEKSKQTITAKDITKTYGDKAFSLGAKTNGGGKLTYKVLNTKIATINKKGKVTIKSCGRTKIKITAAANGKYQAATKTITLTVKPEKLTLTSVKSTKSKALTVKWKQNKKAKGYIIEYSTDKKFKKSVKTVTISKNSTISKIVTKLKGGKTYYVRACAYTTVDGKKIKGSYSKVTTVKVKK